MSSLPDWQCPRLGLYSNDEVAAYAAERKYKAFVYECEVRGMKYIGKRLMQKANGKGALWRSYAGSNAEMEMHKKERPGEVKRTILDFARTRGDAAYMEICWQIYRKAVFREDYYNRMLHVRLNVRGLSPELKDWRPQ